MTKLMSVHVGLNSVDPASYGSRNELTACEADAEDMRGVAEGLGFEPQVLLTADATCEAVLAAIAAGSTQLREGDLFFLTYSGHGGQVPDFDGDEEADNLDETWCLFDSQIRDDDINTALVAFVPGVRVMMLSDSCHSGTVSRDVAIARDKRLSTAPLGRDKHLPLSATVREFEQHENQYRSRTATSKAAVQATGALISGCRDDQESKDGDRNGAFTAAFLTCWNDGRFEGNHNDLHEAVKEKLFNRGYEQVPQLTSVAAQDAAFHTFLAQRPLRA